VYAVLGVCCTRCMLYSVYAVLGVNSWSWHGEIERDDLTLCSAMMVELWTRKGEMGMKMRTMWWIRADMRNQGFDLPDWVGKTSYRGNYTPDRDSYLPYRGWSIESHTKFAKSQFLMTICPINSHLSTSRPQLYRHLRTRSSVIPLYLSMPWSRVNTEYSIHRVQHTPSTAYTEYGIHRVLHHPHTAPSQSLISRQTMLYSIIYIPTITS